jgi:hypothetical protein
MVKRQRKVSVTRGVLLIALGYCGGGRPIIDGSNSRHWTGQNAQTDGNLRLPSRQIVPAIGFDLGQRQAASSHFAMV